MQMDAMFLSLTHRSRSLLLVIFFLGSPPCIPARTMPQFRTDPPTESAIKNHTQSMGRFLDAGCGTRITGMSQLKKYFNHFGYMPLQKDDVDCTDVFDVRFESAVVLFQSTLGLQITGKLDTDTLSQIATPRCGVADTLHGIHATTRYVFFPGKPRWMRPMPMVLTYAFLKDNWINNLSLKDVQNVFQKAFSKWASVIPVSFKETDDYGFADIRIGFYTGDHGDGEAFDGVLGVLAHSFSPESGRLHLDAAETWAVDFESEKSTVAIDLESVATHEIGHLLGLGHSSVKESVMYPSLRPREKKGNLELDDIQGVQALYGSNPNFKFESLQLESDTSVNQGVVLRIRTWGSMILAVLFHLSLNCFHMNFHPHV